MEGGKGDERVGENTAGARELGKEADIRLLRHRVTFSSNQSYHVRYHHVSSEFLGRYYYLCHRVDISSPKVPSGHGLCGTATISPLSKSLVQ